MKTQGGRRKAEGGKGLAGELVRRASDYRESPKEISQRRKGAKSGEFSFLSCFSPFAPLRLCVSPVRRLPRSNRSRRGISIIEVLVSLFVLSVGVLGVAALIPLGKLSMLEVEKSDRTGACGRAALREVKVRRMLDSGNWTAQPSQSAFVIDPLGVNKGMDNTFGSLERISLIYVSANVFIWQDDLAYARAEDAKTAADKLNGDRPMPMPGRANQVADGNFSWFLMVAASPSETKNAWGQSLTWDQRRQFTVSAVVCYKRLFTASQNIADKPGETVVDDVKCDSDTGYGGIGIEFPGKSIIEVKRNEWVLLTTGKQSTWYRVVGVGYDGSTTRMSLVGPDWYGGGTDSSASLVIVEGVTGVYTTTIQRDADGIWTK